MYYYSGGFFCGMAGVKGKSGRKLKIKTPLQLEKMVNAFLLKCKQENTIPYLTALYNSLGFYHSYFQDLANTHPVFLPAVKKMQSRMAEEYEKAMGSKRLSPAHSIFMLKNCGFVDKIDVQANVSGSFSLADLARDARCAKKDKK